MRCSHPGRSPPLELLCCYAAIPQAPSISPGCLMFCFRDHQQITKLCLPKLGSYVPWSERWSCSAWLPTRNDQGNLRRKSDTGGAPVQTDDRITTPSCRMPKQSQHHHSKPTKNPHLVLCPLACIQAHQTRIIWDAPTFAGVRDITHYKAVLGFTFLARASAVKSSSHTDRIQVFLHAKLCRHQMKKLSCLAWWRR